MDIDAKLLKELADHAAGLAIKRMQGDLFDFDKYLSNPAELVVCMTDTILHLETPQKVTALFEKVFAALEENGKFVITFRDLTYELKELDRILPVRSDENTIFTCYLEYEPETVKVHDIVYQRSGETWQLSKSFYRKLRLSESWVKEQLGRAGFREIATNMERGLVTVIAQR